MQMVADMLRTRPELKPSLDVVLHSALDEKDKLVAMELFQASLADPWDPMRDPRQAVIAAAALSAS